MINIYIQNESEYGGEEELLPNPLEGALEIMLALVDNKGKVYSYRKAGEVVAKHFKGATLYISKGLWNKKLERGVVIFIANDSKEMTFREFKVEGKKLLKELKKIFNQEAVMFRFVLPKFSRYNLY